MKLKLRGYQEVLIDNILSKMDSDTNSILVVAPTGAGKTSVFAYFTEQFSTRGLVVWFLVHRKELLAQTHTTFNNFEVPMDNVYVGMIQSALKQTIKPDIIIFDECHLSSAATWQKVIEGNSQALIIGCTATPARTDGQSLGSTYKTMVQAPTTKWLIENKYLSEFDYYAPKLDIDLDALRSRGKDYDMEDFSSKLDRPTIYGEIDKYLDKDKKTLIYSPSVKFSKKLESKYDFVKHLDGETPKDERDEIIRKFRTGEITCITSVNLLSEGFDVPDCEVIMLLRPTKSLILYLQQVGRGLRYQEGKKATIYDMVGNVFTHGLPDEERTWSLEGKIKHKHKGALDIKVRQCDSCLRVYEGKDAICPYCGHDNGKTRAEIARDRKIELEKITEMKKKKDRMEVGMASTLDELIALGRSRGYQNPKFWALMIMKGRRGKLK